MRPNGPQGPLRVPPEVLTSNAWPLLCQYLDARIAKLRTENDGKLSHEDTMFLRGKITALKDLRHSGERPAPEADPPAGQ